MRLASWTLVVVAGCSSTTNYPIQGSGDGGFVVDSRTADSRRTDARVDSGPPAAVDAALISGRVCLTADARQLDACATTGADGLTVRLGDGVTTTAADGRFTIAVAGTPTLWRVSGPIIVSSYMVFSDYLIPAFSTATYSALKTANNVVLEAGQGSIIVEVVKNGAGSSGATAFTTPTSTYAAFYDGGSATIWTQTSTGANGIGWLAGLDVGSTTATVSVTPSGATAPLTTPPQPIFDGGITFATVVIP